MFKPTHLTREGQPVEMLADCGTPDYRSIRFRSGFETACAEAGLIPLGSAEAQEILAEVTGQDATQAETEALEDRATLARWGQRLDVSRKTLSDAIAGVLELQGNDGPGWAARRVLERALAQSGEDLATFWP